jgi:hypothetical protein
MSSLTSGVLIVFVFFSIVTVGTIWLCRDEIFEGLNKE